MQEKFSVVLEAVTNGFKTKMNEIKNVGEQTTVKMAQLKREIQTLKSEMKYTDPGSRAFKEYALAVDDAEKELKELNQAQKQVKSNSGIFSNLGSGMSKIGGQIEGATKKVLRYGMAMLSIRGIFGLVRKASSSYLSQDTELANKLQSAWAGLGAFLAPLIEWIANKILRLVKYMNIFIKAVTGQDLLAKAANKATKSINSQTKATKGLNKSLSDMDEITNIQKDETSGVGGGVGGDNPFDSLSNVDIDMEWADKIRSFGEWVRTNWKKILATLAMTGTVLAGIKLATFGGSFASFGRILAGVGVAVWGLYMAFENLKDYLDLMDQGLEDTKKGWQTFWNVIKYVGIAIAGVGIALGAWPVVLAGAAIAIFAVIGKYWKDIEKWLDKTSKKINDWAVSVFGEDLADIIMEPFNNAVSKIKTLFGGLYDSIKDIADGIIKLFKGDVSKGFEKIGKGIGNLLITGINNAIGLINDILFPMRAIIVALGKIAGQKVSMKNVKIPLIPKLDTGTGYVPEDQLAYIHKGEAVIPKKFNSVEYFSNMNDNTETNALLLDVNRTLVDILNKDTTLNVNGKELARTTYQDFKNEGNRLGNSSVVTTR